MTGRAIILSLLIALVAATFAQTIQAYTPESEEVVAAVERAVRYLEKAQGALGGDDSVGESALVALALLKAGRPLGHPRIQSALKICANYASTVNADKDFTMYAPAIVSIFLMEADAKRFRPQIGRLLGLILRRQLPIGAWGYKGDQNGDTSQSQYCVLALWEAYSHGFRVDLKDAAKACYWLIRTQDQSGGFAYIPRDPGAVGKRVSQSGVTHSMAAAGTGSLYICMDLLGFEGTDIGDDAEGELPPNVRLVSEDETENTGKKRPGPALGLVDLRVLNAATSAGNNWFQRNFKIKYGGEWQYYYMYGLERYQSFREKVENRIIADPKWYNDGVEFLLKEQSSDGSWMSEGQSGPAGTCFAVFFLTRSTQKTIGAILLNQGVLKGGQGFQDGELRSRNGKIVTVPVSRSVGDLLASLDEVDEDEMANMAKSITDLKFEGDAATRTQQEAMLRGLVSHRSYGARIMAVKTIAKQRNLDNVPPLIYALSDPDWRVALEARNGLRFISRKINGFGMPKQPNKGEVTAATQKWKAWFLSVRPDGQFFN